MNTIKKSEHIKKDLFIEIGKIKPFYNICKVSNIKEEVNIEIEYVPDKLLIELESYREYFKQEFNEYIENLAFIIHEHIENLIKPKQLKVKVYLTEKKLTSWSVTIQ